MRDIEGIDRVVAHLRPHFDQIEARFTAENEKYITLMERPHDVIGRLLKCHLVVEHYLGRFLWEHYGIEDLEAAKLGFFNKAALLPDRASSAAFVKPGIMKLNSLRNRMGHQLGFDITLNDLGPINAVLSVARPNIVFMEPMDAIEAFTTVARTWLIVPPPAHQALFEEAFAEIRLPTG